MKKRISFTLAGAFFGAFFGAGTGIVGAFGGISGLIVFTILGGIVGFLATPDISRLASRISKNQNKG